MKEIKFVVWFADIFMYRGRIVSETHDKIELEVQNSLNFPGICSSWSHGGYCWVLKSAVKDQNDGFAQVDDLTSLQFK